jgi:hypothetical protein
MDTNRRVIDDETLPLESRVRAEVDEVAYPFPGGPKII